MTQAFQIPSMPAIIPTATYLTPQTVASYQSIDDVPYILQAMETVMVYIDSNGNIFHLNGPQAGQEGVYFYENLQGEQHLPFEQVTIESAWMWGSIIQRQDYQCHKINFRVFIGGPAMNNITYRMSEERWWAGQDEVNGGWFGQFTRFSGWRWLQVWPEKTVTTTQKRDPVAYDNNGAIWDVQWLAPLPNYGKPALISNPWLASAAGPPDKNGFYHGVIAMPNRGDLKGYVRYLINGAGTAIVQDNNSTNMVTLPQLFTADGQGLCDTDPLHKTLVAENDPFDVGFYNTLSASGILSFFLTGQPAAASEAWWLRGYVRFIYSVAPNSVVQLHVMHNNPNAQIVAQLPQRYKRGR
jgi:hypothetical protein